MWTLTQLWTRCGNKRCRACRGDEMIRPHGPYYRLSRHRPGTKDAKDEIYIGTPRKHKWLKDPRIRALVEKHFNRYWAFGDQPKQDDIIRVGEKISTGRPVW